MPDFLNYSLPDDFSDYLTLNPDPELNNITTDKDQSLGSIPHENNVEVVSFENNAVIENNEVANGAKDNNESNQGDLQSAKILLSLSRNELSE